MYPTVYLHIGINKTGTTAIQRHLQMKRRDYRKLGLLYPKTAEAVSAHYVLSSSLGFHYHYMPAEWRRGVDELRQKFERELRDWSGRAIVFSSENFVLKCPVEPVREFFDGWPTKVIVYLRRHDHWWMSSYTQTLKMRAMPPWPRGVVGYIEFSKKQKKYFARYRELVDRWADCFGKENVIVRPYEEQQIRGDVINDFLAVIGVSRVGAEDSDERSNVGIPPMAMHLLDIFQRARIDERCRKRLLEYAMSLREGERQNLIPPSLRRSLIEENAEDYEYIAREYLGREDGRLFYEPLPDPDPSWKAPRQPAPREVVEATVAALTGADITK